MTNKRFTIKLMAACALATGLAGQIGLAQAQTKLKWAHVYSSWAPSTSS
jgi:hypothetical protein